MADERSGAGGGGGGGDADVDAALRRWQPPGPPDGFADRVIAAQSEAPAPARTRPRPGWPTWTVAGVAVGVVAALLLWPASAPPPITVAARTITGRETIVLGGRGVAVAEPGAILGWRRAGAAALVHQDAGDVFYRVDPGGPFTVTTPAGEVRVTGTCFRVEVLPMKPSKQALIGAAAGAAIATLAVVTVYEGKVLVASPAGKTEVVAGERATLTPGTTPTVEAATPVVAAAAIEVPAEPSSTATREELLVRDKAQREQIAALSARLKQLEAAGGPAAGGKRGPGGRPGDDSSWVDPSKEELLAWAKDCRVQIDLPPVMRGQPLQISPDMAKSAGLTDAEVAVANQVFVDLTADWRRRVRGWYLEGTGDTQGADQLSAYAMGQELQDKAADGEPEGLQRRLSQERAGLVAPPADPARLSPYERYFRALADLGNEAERQLAAKLGDEKAHGLRRFGGGWPMRMSMEGCPPEGASGGGPVVP